MNAYTLHAWGICPADGARDFYRIVVRSPSMVRVEAIRQAVSDLTASPIYQEDLTVSLAARLGAAVEVVGWHQGVHVSSSAG